jgi:hypothetical protein
MMQPFWFAGPIITPVFSEHSETWENGHLCKSATCHSLSQNISECTSYTEMANLPEEKSFALN